MIKQLETIKKELQIMIKVILKLVKLGVTKPEVKLLRDVKTMSRIMDIKLLGTEILGRR